MHVVCVFVFVYFGAEIEFEDYFASKRTCDVMCFVECAFRACRVLCMWCVYTCVHVFGAEVELEDYFAGKCVCDLMCFVVCVLCGVSSLWCVLLVHVAFCRMCFLCLLCFVHVVCVYVCACFCAAIEFNAYFAGKCVCDVMCFVGCAFCACCILSIWCVYMCVFFGAEIELEDCLGCLCGAVSCVFGVLCTLCVCLHSSCI